MNIQIGVNESNQRFDRFLRKYFRKSSFITLMQIYAWIRKGQVKVNARKQHEKYMLTLGDIVMIHDQIVAEFHLGSQTHTHRPSLNIQQIRQQIIAEDQDRIVRNKPPHLLVHPAHDMSEITLNDYLESYYRYQSKQMTDPPVDSTFKASFGFRLDKDTSGVIIGAKNYQSLQYLNEQIRLRQTIKYYIAILVGKPQGYLDMQEPLFKGFSDTRGKAEVFVNHEKGLSARTELIPILTTQDPKLGTLTATILRLHTGRMHQIRVHCAYHGYPIVGDLIYGDPRINQLAQHKYRITRQLLHCYRYGLKKRKSDSQDSSSTYQRWTAPLPHDMTMLFSQELLIEKISDALNKC